MVDLDKFDLNNLPRHVAIIMDGNGRWAKSRNLDRTQGHKEGVKRAEEILEIAHFYNIKVLTLFTFSTENWNRPKAEVSMLMHTLATVLDRKIDKLQKYNVRFQMIGKEDRIPESVLKTIHRVMEETKDNTGVVLNLAFNYGSRLEILDAIKKISVDVKEGRLNPEDIDESTVSEALYTHNLRDPDLLIRTSGEKRISNFLLWQLSYAEFYFTDKLWPEFDKEEFEKALLDYQNRERRYGKVRAVAR